MPPRAAPPSAVAGAARARTTRIRTIGAVTGTARPGGRRCTRSGSGNANAAPPCCRHSTGSRCLDSCVRACLAAGGPLTPAQRQLLATAVDALDERIRPEVWRDDRAAYFRARDLLQVARFMEIAAEAA